MAVAKHITPAFVRTWIPPRKKNTHKGGAGRVFIIAGSRGMAGAAVLCAIGAVRSGAGLVRLGIVKSQQDNVVKRAPLEVTTQALPEEAPGQISEKCISVIQKTIKNFKPHVVAVGPGLGTNKAVKKLVRYLLSWGRIPVVLDADGLNVLSQMKRPWEISVPVVLTPHAGEMGRLLGWSPKRVMEQKKTALSDLVHLTAGVCLLKGAGSFISDGQELWKNTTGNPGMASGGMGDILTGVIASFWAQMPRQNRSTGIKAACAGAYVHGLAADLALTRYPERTLLASDLGEFFPAAFKKIFRRRK